MKFFYAIEQAGDKLSLELPGLRHPEPLATLAYGSEVKLKNEALAIFWKEHGLPGRPEPLVASPVPRKYRHTSKRRSSIVSHRLALGFGGERAPRPGVTGSDLDPVEHLHIYAWTLEKLEENWGFPMARVLNWVVVRGVAGDLCVIWNLRKLDAEIVRTAKRLAEGLQAAELGVTSAWLYNDPTDSEYYMESERPEKEVGMKKMFGPPLLRANITWSPTGPKGAKEKLTLHYPPTAFFQGNTSMLPALLGTVAQAAGPLEGKTLLDLYCGSGLFAFAMGQKAAQVYGVDWEGPGIEAAKGTAHHLKASKRIRFWSGAIDPEFLEARLPAPKTGEVVVLDPPRNGPGEGVIAALAERGPERVVQVCCGTDSIPSSLADWYEAGYVLERAIPLDLFPGTAGLETVLVLRPE